MLELVLRLGVSLAVVLGLFWLVARTGSKRLGGARSLMRVRARQSLSRTASLAVVEVGDRVLVVGVGDGGVRLLTELDPTTLETAEADQGTGATSPLAAVRSRWPISLAARTGNDGEEAAAVVTAGAAPAGALRGSLLSAQTWKQAWDAATAKASPRAAVPVIGSTVVASSGATVDGPADD